MAVPDDAGRQYRWRPWPPRTSRRGGRRHRQERRAAPRPPRPPHRPVAAGGPPSSWVLVVLACLLAVVSVLAVFVRNQLLNTDAYVATMAPLASNPAIQTQVAKKVSENLIVHTDVEQRVKNALPPKAGFLATPHHRRSRDRDRPAGPEGGPEPPVREGLGHRQPGLPQAAGGGPDRLGQRLGVDGQRSGHHRPVRGGGAGQESTSTPRASRSSTRSPRCKGLNFVLFQSNSAGQDPAADQAAEQPVHRPAHHHAPPLRRVGGAGPQPETGPGAGRHRPGPVDGPDPGGHRGGPEPVPGQPPHRPVPGRQLRRRRHRHVVPPGRRADHPDRGRGGGRPLPPGRLQDIRSLATTSGHRPG